MMKSKLVVTWAAAGLAVLLLPASASAQWTHNHQPLQSNAQIQTTGQFGWEGEIGGLECEIDTRSTLLAGQTTASVTQFEIDLTEAGDPTPTQKCRVTTTLEFLGCTDVSQMTAAGLPWTSHAVNTQQVAMTTGTIQFHLHGGIFCPKTIQLTPGTLSLNMSTSNTWTTNQVHGTLKAHPNDQNVTITGHWFITPSGTYGVV